MHELKYIKEGMWANCNNVTLKTRLIKLPAVFVVHSENVLFSVLIPHSVIHEGGKLHI